LAASLFFLESSSAVPSGSHPRAEPPMLLIPFIAILPFVFAAMLDGEAVERA
jgi:hypothetical protein